MQNLDEIAILFSTKPYFIVLVWFLKKKKAAEKAPIKHPG